MELFELEPAYCFWFCMAPSELVPTSLEILAKTRMGIVFRLGDIPMLDWIVMDVMEVVREVLFLADHVIPKAALPEVDRSIDSICALVV